MELGNRNVVDTWRRMSWNWGLAYLQATLPGSPHPYWSASPFSQFTWLKMATPDSSQVDSSHPVQFPKFLGKSPIWLGGCPSLGEN